MSMQKSTKGFQAFGLFCARTQNRMKKIYFKQEKWRENSDGSYQEAIILQRLPLQRGSRF